MNDINPVTFGQLIARVTTLERQVSDANTKLDSLIATMSEIKGGKKALYVVWCFIGSIIGIIGTIAAIKGGN